MRWQKQVFVHTQLSRAYLALNRLSCILYHSMYCIGQTITVLMHGVFLLVSGYFGNDCSLDVALPPVITGIRMGPVCDVRGPQPCTFLSLFVTGVHFSASFVCKFVRNIPCCESLQRFACILLYLLISQLFLCLA